ncbi:unnamed protein product, partial [marine sediment metagenome]
AFDRQAKLAGGGASKIKEIVDDIIANGYSPEEGAKE